MSFRKKNISIVSTRGAAQTSQNPTTSSTSPPTAAAASTSASTSTTTTTTTSIPPTPPAPGTRPSPQTSHPTTSTGTPSLDALLGGHSGLPLGHTLLIEESGTTDFGGALLRYFAAEGILQGHHVTVIGAGEGWTRELPGDVSAEEGGSGSGKSKTGAGEKERMKIAWRYERLGEFSAAPGLGGGTNINKSQINAPPPLSGGGDSHETPSSNTTTPTPTTPFCHSFDLTKRLQIPPTANLSHIALPPPFSTPTQPPLPILLGKITSIIESSPANSIHRLVFPSLLSPAIYPPTACAATNILQFLHGLRALCRRYGTRVVAMMSLPTELYPRETGMVRWMEKLCDGVVEICPLQHLMEKASRIGAKMKDDIPMGVVRVWQVPGGGRVVGGSWAGGAIAGGGGASGGGGAGGEDLAFTVTRKRFQISMFSLPPADEEDAEAEAQKSGGGGAGVKVGGDGHGHDHSHGGKTKVDIEF